MLLAYSQKSSTLKSNRKRFEPDTSHAYIYFCCIYHKPVTTLQIDVQTLKSEQFDSYKGCKFAITIYFFFDDLTKGVDFQMAFYVFFAASRLANLIVKSKQCFLIGGPCAPVEICKSIKLVPFQWLFRAPVEDFSISPLFIFKKGLMDLAR